MARLPVPGSDDNQWGDILNDYLSQVHAADGALKDASVSEAKLDSPLQTKINSKANTSSLHAVATSGSYADLTNKPTIVSDITSLTDTTIASPVTDQVLSYDAATSKWINKAQAVASVVGQTGDVTGAQIADHSALTSKYVAGYVLPPASGGDDTAAIQAVFDAASAAKSHPWGSVNRVTCPQGQAYNAVGLTIPSGIDIDLAGSHISANANGTILTFTGAYSCVRNATFFGKGNAGLTTTGAIINAGSFTNSIVDCRFNFFTSHAIRDEGNATRIVHIMAQNCLLGADTLTGYTGVVELAGVDAWVESCEMTASRDVPGMSASKFACALAIKNSNNMCSNILAETSDHGVYLSNGATLTNLVGVRGELNQGHGWVIEGGSGRAVGCHALRNSKAGTLLYDGFHATGGNWTFVGPFSQSGDGGNPQHKHGIYDAQVAQGFRNIWTAPIIMGDGTPFYSANYSITSFAFPNAQGFKRLSGSNSISVGGLTRISMINNAATNIDTILQGVNGQEIIVRGDGFSTIVANAGIVTLGGGNLLLAGNKFYRFVHHHGVWYQL